MGGAAIAPGFAWAQARKMSLVALFPGEEEDDQPAAQPFFDELRRRGWVEGTNIDYERMYGRGTREYMEGLAKSAAAREPDLIYASTAAIALAVLKETDSVPVVFTSASDPVASGLVASLRAPGRNATGAYQSAGNGLRRRVQLMRQILPNATRIGLVLDRRATESARQRTLHEEELKALPGMQLTVAEFTNFEAVAKLFANFRREGVQAVLLSPSVTLLGRRRDVADTATRNRLALIGHRLEWAEAGALLTYGPDVTDTLRRSAAIADRVLRGAKPADTAVEQSNRSELIVNQRSAKALGVNVSPELLKSADRVIE
ncbi:MAG TPA: ABC transporter substrate-binding protein [Burkholderiales bacterium]|nr:ABC transporter substrate-binding protein [Burkholderiales bacterium]